VMVAPALRLPQGMIEGKQRCQRSAGILEGESARTITNTAFKGSSLLR
jgi:hypothetical protein